MTRRATYITFALSLVVVLLVAPAYGLPGTDSTVFINEIHYDNAGADQFEGVEIAGPAGTDLANWSLAFYNGTNGAVYDTVLLSGILSNQQNDYGALWFPVQGVENGGPDGIAFVDDVGTVIQFLSYEGEFTATDGPAAGIQSTDIVVSEEGSPVGDSLQLTGAGNTYGDFTWVGPIPSTYGQPNVGQIFVPLASELEVVKRIEGQDANTPVEAYVASYGEPVEVTFDITNIGTESLSNLALTDDTEVLNGNPADPQPVACPPLTGLTLAPNESVTCTLVVQPEYGVSGDLGTVTGLGATTGTVATDDDPAWVSLLTDPNVDVVKTINGQDAHTPQTAVRTSYGAELTFVFLIQNIGDEPLDNVVVSDDVLGPVTCDQVPDGGLDPSATLACNPIAEHAGYHPVGSEHVDTVDVEAVGVASQTIVSASDTAYYVTNELVPEIDVTKTLNGSAADGLDEAVIVVEGDQLTYEFVVTNTGDEPLEDIALTDSAYGLMACPQSVLVEDESMACTPFVTAAQTAMTGSENIATADAGGEVTRGSVKATDSAWYVTTESTTTTTAISTTTTTTEGTTSTTSVPLVPTDPTEGVAGLPVTGAPLTLFVWLGMLAFLTGAALVWTHRARINDSGRR